MTQHVNHHHVNRRDFLKHTAASAAALSFATPAIAQNTGGRVVVVGGGFAGASCARALKRLDPKTSSRWSKRARPSPPARSATT